MEQGLPPAIHSQRIGVAMAALGLTPAQLQSFDDRGCAAQGDEEDCDVDPTTPCRACRFAGHNRREEQSDDPRYPLADPASAGSHPRASSTPSAATTTVVISSPSTAMAPAGTGLRSPRDRRRSRSSRLGRRSMADVVERSALYHIRRMRLTPIVHEMTVGRLATIL